jgi:hypothetical protein
MWISCFARLSLGIGLAITGVASGAAQEKVKIGMVMPLTGTLAAAGKQVAAGARLYVREHIVVRDGQAPHPGGDRQRQGRHYRGWADR